MPSGSAELSQPGPRFVPVHQPPSSPDPNVDVSEELARTLGMRRAGTNTVRSVAQYVLESSNLSDDVLRDCRRPGGGPATAATYHYLCRLGLLLTPPTFGRPMSISERCDRARDDLPPQRWDDCLSILLDLGFTEGAFPAGAVRDVGHHLRRYLGKESEETARRLLRRWGDSGLVALRA